MDHKTGPSLVEKFLRVSKDSGTFFHMQVSLQCFLKVLARELINVHNLELNNSKNLEIKNSFLHNAKTALKLKKFKPHLNRYYIPLRLLNYHFRAVYSQH